MSNPDEPAAAAGPISSSEDAIRASLPPTPPPDPGPLDRLVDRPLTAEGLARAHWQLDRFLAVLLFLLAFALASFAIHNSDFWMYLATGRALANGTYDVLEGNDPFSYTTEGVRWINHAWLFDWAVYGLYGFLGGQGLVVLKSFVVVILAVVLFQIRRPGLSLWAPVVCVGVALLALSPRLLFQPTIVSFLFLGVTLSLLMRAVGICPADAARSADGAPSGRSLWVLPPLCALWANLDSWFLLGPLTVVLFLLGDWLQQFLAGSGKSELKSRKGLVLVLFVGLAACLLNPSGVRVFALPPDLAYLVVQVTGPVPSEYLAAGNTLYELASVDAALVPFLSPLRYDFWSQPSIGLNVAGMSYFVLLGLGVLSFLLAALAGIRTSATGLPTGFGPRLVIWLVYAALSLFLVRLIPFFALVAGPITALNFQDFAQWCFGTQVRVEGKWRLWSLGGRLATAAGSLGLLFLAWPGWLHAAPEDPHLTHRIAWRLDEDPSLRRAAQRIGELQQSGKLGHGFNYVPDVVNYLSWFSPGTKGFFDHRFALFAGCADQYARARQSLREEGEYFFKLRQDPRTVPPRRDWQEVFRARGINYVVLTAVDKKPLLSELAVSFWLSQASWVPLYADGRTVIFGWIEPGPRDQFAGLEWDLNRLAFGPVAEDRRAPLEAPEPPPEPPGFWLQYWLGPPPEPLAAATARQCLELYQNVAQRWVQAYLPAWQVACWPGPIGTAGIIPGSVSGPAAAAALVRLPQNVLLYRDRQGRGFLRPKESGPPGAAVVAVRSARRAVAASPADPGSQLVLADAVQNLWKRQEQYWVPWQPIGGPASFQEVRPLDRQTLRMVQFLTALEQFVSLKGDQPQSVLVDVHWDLAQLYVRMHYLDLGLEHFARAREILADLPPPPELKDNFTRKREELDRVYKILNTEVKKRQEYYDLKTSAGKMTALERFEIALWKPYRATDENNRVTEDRQGLGLARRALDVLGQMNLAELPDQQKAISAKLQLALLLTMGRVREAQDVLVPTLKPLLGQEEYERFEVMLGAATGNYRRADQALATLEKIAVISQKQQQAQRLKILEQTRASLLTTLAFDPPLQTLPVPRASLYLLQQLMVRSPIVPPVPEQRIQLRVLRGLLALEQGDTGMALIHFEGALRRAGPEPFPDRPIAERYVQLLSPR